MKIIILLGDCYILANDYFRRLLRNGRIGLQDELDIRSYYKGYLSRLYENK